MTYYFYYSIDLLAQHKTHYWIINISRMAECCSSHWN